MAVFAICCVNFVFSQNKGAVKGYVYDQNTGVELEGASVVVKNNSSLGTSSNIQGYYILNGLDVGKVVLMYSFVGYDTVYKEVNISSGKTEVINVYLNPKFYEISGVKIKDKTKKIISTDPDVGLTRITNTQLTKIPTIGGVPDLVQYLQILPGVVFSGDQGGQLYIRGGSPVMNKIILDGMTIYNPFHSIGLFSVFDADFIKSADVYSAGFGAEYGGRVSAIVDVKTRDGNKKELGGKVILSPFLSKLSLEGPIRKFKPNKTNSNFILSWKNSYLDKTSKIFYPYINSNQLPYSFNDIYGKYTVNSSGGSSVKLFGFNFRDKVSFKNSTEYKWNQSGFGMRFNFVPEGKQGNVNGFLTYSDYKINQNEKDNKPRNSGINGLNMGLNFDGKVSKDEYKFGFDVNAFKTEFQIYNSNDRFIDQYENTTELCGYFLYKFVRPLYTLELGVREQYYASLANGYFEPRVNGRYNIRKNFRVKGAFGRYSQNLISAFSDRDVVNLFYGFLSGPDDLPKTFNGNPVEKRIQTAWHYVLGLEWDIKKFGEISIEWFRKEFTQISNINRDKIFEDVEDYANKPERQRKNYIIETGNAYGGDIRYKYEDKKYYIWAVYSLTYVNRFDGLDKYNPHWDRRHNINLVGDMALDKNGKLSANARWNYGSGFPFTQTQGFYEKIDFSQGNNTNYTTDNGNLGILYGPLNGGRLPSYHRLDVSLTYYLKKTKKIKTWVVLAITNVYNRENVFYFDRFNYSRVNQLPTIPSLSLNASF